MAFCVYCSERFQLQAGHAQGKEPACCGLHLFPRHEGDTAFLSFIPHVFLMLDLAEVKIDFLGNTNSSLSLTLSFTKERVEKRKGETLTFFFFFEYPSRALIDTCSLWLCTQT